MEKRNPERGNIWDPLQRFHYLHSRTRRARHESENAQISSSQPHIFVPPGLRLNLSPICDLQCLLKLQAKPEEVDFQITPPAFDGCAYANWHTPVKVKERKEESHKQEREMEVRLSLMGRHRASCQFSFWKEHSEEPCLLLQRRENTKYTYFKNVLNHTFIFHYLPSVVLRKGRKMIE